MPLELLVIVAGIYFGARRGALIAYIGSLAAAAIGYAVGRVIGAQEIARWMSPRSHRSIRQLDARSVAGMVALRLAGVASTRSIHLACGAGRVPFATYMTGSAIGLAPAIVALAGLGGVLRHALLDPSVATAVAGLAAALLLSLAALGLRALLLIRHFAPSVSSHRQRSEYG
jgi:uncharacterized membrane protein YdjX (TVP38/TMEM64 family)